jgi:predicted Zn-dependent protease
MSDHLFAQNVETSYPGSAFHPSFPRGKASGTIRVTQSGVSFETETARVELPLRDLKIRLGGARDRLVFFEHPARPDWSLFTSDRTILKHPAFAGDPQFIDLMGNVRNRRRMAVGVFLAVVAAVVGLVVAAFALKDPMVRSVAARIPVEWEKQIGDTVMRQIELQTKVLKSAELDRQLEALAEPLVIGIPDKRYEFKFHIVEEATINAFALPGGQVIVHSGLLQAADSPEEVAGVLAHEIAHATLRHGLQKLVESVGLFVIIQGFVGDVGGILAVVADNASFLMTQKFSRDLEREADEAGWGYLERSNIDPRGLIRFFEKIETERDKLLKDNPMAKIEDAMAFISTHPAGKERIKTLKEKWERTSRKSGFHEFDMDFPAFQQSLKGLLHTRQAGEKP